MEVVQRYNQLKLACTCTAFKVRHPLYPNTPDNRYLKFLSDYPDLVQRIPQYYIAAYVGVKASSLSRSRKRLAARR